MLADLHSWGKAPNLNEVSNIICNGWTISSLISHKILGCIKSGTSDLDVLKFFNLSKIFSFSLGQGYLVAVDGSLL